MSTSELESFLASCAEVLLLDPSEVSATSHGVDGDTPLHVAVWQSNIKAVSLLIEAGADVDAKGEMSETPLHVALTQRNILAVKILLSAGANPDST